MISYGVCRKGDLETLRAEWGLQGIILRILFNYSYNKFCRNIEIIFDTHNYFFNIIFDLYNILYQSDRPLDV
jgi:hypothetical protein